MATVASRASAWACTMCTFINEADREDCELCGAVYTPPTHAASGHPKMATAAVPAGQATAVRPPTSPPATRSGASVQSPAPHPGAWTCEACTFENSGGIKCTLCDHPKESRSPRAADAVWSCAVCSCENTALALVCTACSAIKSVSSAVRVDEEVVCVDASPADGAVAILLGEGYEYSLVCAALAAEPTLAGARAWLAAGKGLCGFCQCSAHSSQSAVIVLPCQHTYHHTCLKMIIEADCDKSYCEASVSCKACGANIPPTCIAQAVGSEEYERSKKAAASRARFVEEFIQNFMQTLSEVRDIITVPAADEEEAILAADTASALVTSMEQLLRDNKSHALAFRKQLLQAGAYDFLLLQIGQVEDLAPRKPEIAKRFEDERIRNENSAKLAAKVAADAPQAASRRRPRKRDPAASSSSSTVAWSRGTGYSYDGAATHTVAADPAAIQALHKKRAKQTGVLLKLLESMVSSPVEEPLLDDALQVGILQSLDASCLVPVLEAHLRMGEVQILSDLRLHGTVYSMLLALARVPRLAVLLTKLPGQTESLVELVKQQMQVATDFVTTEEAPDPLALRIMKSSVRIGNEVCLTLANAGHTSAATTATAAAAAGAPPAGGAPADPEAKTSSDTYEAQLRPLLVGAMQIVPKAGASFEHHYAAQLAACQSTVQQSVIKRVKAELRSLKKDLPLSPDGSIFVRHDAARPYWMKVLITGPVDTPYDSGCFLFDLYCGPTYPLAPPSINLMTTGGGTVRFNPNLYNCGKVCLSLLGTWRGGDRTEEWTEHSTLLQLFVSIQSLIMVKFPYYNEPGFESRHDAAAARTNPNGFEEVVRLHFKWRKDHILARLTEWTQEAGSREAHIAGYKAVMDKLLQQAKDAFAHVH